MQARSSVAEHCPYVAGVGGSIPSAPKPWRGPAGLPAAMIMMLLGGRRSRLRHGPHPIRPTRQNSAFFA